MRDDAPQGTSAESPRRLSRRGVDATPALAINDARAVFAVPGGRQVIGPPLTNVDDVRARPIG